MQRIFWVLCCAFLIPTAAQASMTNEELQDAQRRIIERETKKMEAKQSKEDLRQERVNIVSQAITNKEYDKALSLAYGFLEEISDDRVERAEMLVLRSIAYYQKGEMFWAKDEATKALKENSREVRAYVVRSNAYEQEKNYEKAIADMEAYLQLKPNDEAGKNRLNILKNSRLQQPESTPKPTPPPTTDTNKPAPEAEPVAAVQKSANTPLPPVTSPETAMQGQISSFGQKPVGNTEIPELQFRESPDKSYALHKPADWVVTEEPLQNSLRITVMPPAKDAVVDFFWIRNETGTVDAIQALAAYQKKLVTRGGVLEWKNAYKSSDGSKATVSMVYRSPGLALEGTLYLEASAKSLSVQGYMAPEGKLVQQRPLLYNIMSSLVFAKKPPAGSGAGGTQAFAPQYISLPLVNQRAQDGSLTMMTPGDWGFVAGQGRVITSSADGSMGFALLAFDGNPILQGAQVTQGVIAHKYMHPKQAIQTILTGFGHSNIQIQESRSDAATSQQMYGLLKRASEAHDIQLTWVSAHKAFCQGFFKVISAAPSPTGLWFCLIAGIWGPQKDFYRYYPMLEKISSSFAINDQYARKYIQDGLQRAKALHDQTVAAMKSNQSYREQQQADWEAKQQRKDFVDSKWDDYWRGHTYWVSTLENGRVYQTDSHGLKDTGSGTYYEGNGFSTTQFKGLNPKHPSETMVEVPRYVLENMPAK